jgi:DNA-binding transcriptional LysR family regulator
MINPHHLELFYYVARHGGISRAVRRMPYGIQQPAMSGQILELEQDLSLKLFERVPFRLTPEGEELYAFVRPFFENLAAMETRLRDVRVPQLRIGAAELVLCEHLPALIERIRRHHPRLRLSLRSGYQAQLEGWRLDREIDLAITTQETRPPPGLHHESLVRLPLVLLVPRRSPLRSAAELWAQSHLDEPLISLPPTETISRHFQRGLRRRGLTWTPAIVASSMETVTRYVAGGYGIGVSVDAGENPRRPRVRLLPLEGFAPIEIVALWAGRPLPVVATALECIRDYAKEKWPRGSAA